MEIIEAIGADTTKNFYAVNLIGHGCIVMAKKAGQLKNLEYISRKMPERLVED